MEAETALQSRLTGSSGNENPYAIAKSMGDEMTAAATVVKTEESRMTEALDTIRSLQDRAKNIGLSDTGLWTNQNLSFARAVPDMLALAEVMLMGGIERKESRGSHYRTDYPDRVDDPFLASTVAKWNGVHLPLSSNPCNSALSSHGLAPTARSRPHNKPRDNCWFYSGKIQSITRSMATNRATMPLDMILANMPKSSSRSPDCRSKRASLLPRSTSRQQRPQ